MMQTIFDKKVALILLYVGSRYDFSAKKFHQLCDDKGVTVSVCKSEHGNVFGFFTSVPWKSQGGGKPVDGEAFFFKFEGDKGVQKLHMKDGKASYWHSENMLCSNGYNFYIKDKAHLLTSSRGFLNT